MALKKTGIFARRDLNKSEREEDFQLRMKLQQMRENQGRIFVIKMGKIVEVGSRLNKL